MNGRGFHDEGREWAGKGGKSSFRGKQNGEQRPDGTNKTRGEIYKMEWVLLFKKISAINETSMKN